MKDYGFRNLVFEGGGVKGIAYGGALLELEEIGLLPRVRRVAGTSAGAITAALLAVGYSAADVSRIIAETDFRRFADDDPGVIRDVARFITRYGWHKGRAVENWLASLIAERTGDPGLTFAELARTARRRRARYLYVVGTNLSRRVSEVYSHETTPEMPVVRAVRISMSIALYFQAVRRGSEVLVDGGLADNFPLNLFDRRRYLARRENGEEVGYYDRRGWVFNHETLGFRLGSRDEAEYERRGWGGGAGRIRNIRDYVMALAGYLQEMANRRHLHANDWNRTVFIETFGVKATDFGLSRQMVERLVASGREGVRAHLAWRSSPHGTPLPVL